MAASQLLCAQPLKRFIKTTHGTAAMDPLLFGAVAVAGAEAGAGVIG